MKNVLRLLFIHHIISDTEHVGAQSAAPGFRKL